jgi:hypothetical protein
MAHTPFHGLMQPGRRPSMQFQQLNQAYQSDPRRILGQALMGQGASSAPVRTPLQGLGRLSSALVGAYLQRKAGDAQVERETAMTDQIMGMLGPNVAPNVRAAVAANPAAAQTAMLAAQFAPTTQSELTNLGGFTGVRTTQTNPITGQTSSTIGNLVQPRAPAKQDFVTLVDPKDPAKIQTLPLGDPEITTLISQGYVERQGAGTNVTVNPNVAIEAGETKFAEGMATAQIKALEKISADASTAGENADVINQILGIYNRVEGVADQDLTGSGAEFLLDAQEAIIGAGRLFGFSPQEAGIDIDSISDQQTLRAAFSKLSLEMTKILKGALSNRELGVAEKATANFGNTPEANRMILLTQLAASEKLQFLENEAYRYIYGDGTEQNKGNGNLGPGSIDGRNYSSFAQYQREIKGDKEFMFRRMIPKLQLGDVSAFVKLLGGQDELSDELAQELASHITDLRS